MDGQVDSKALYQECTKVSQQNVWLSIACIIYNNCAKKSQKSWIKGSRRGQGRRKNAFGQEGRNKRIRFSVHFDANSDEFNHLAHTTHLFLGGEQALREPLRPLNVPLQPHMSIADIPLHP